MQALSSYVATFYNQLNSKLLVQTIYMTNEINWWIYEGVW